MKEKIFIDLDGVLANFALGVHRLGFNLNKIMESNDSKKKESYGLLLEKILLFGMI